MCPSTGQVGVRESESQLDPIDGPQATMRALALRRRHGGGGGGRWRWAAAASAACRAAFASAAPGSARAVSPLPPLAGTVQPHRAHLLLCTGTAGRRRGPSTKAGR